MKKIKRVVAPEAAHRYSETLDLAAFAISNFVFWIFWNICLYQDSNFFFWKNLLDLKKERKELPLVLDVLAGACFLVGRLWLGAG